MEVLEDEKGICVKLEKVVQSKNRVWIGYHRFLTVGEPVNTRPNVNLDRFPTG